MKKKLANLLRRLASRLAPQAPGKIAVGFKVETYDVKRLRIPRHFTSEEIRLIEKDTDTAVLIDEGARRQLLRSIGEALYAAGAVKFRYEPEPIPGGNDCLIAEVYAAIKQQDNKPNK